MWSCPKCKREFQKQNQAHSCTVYPLEKHFAGKEKTKELFNDLKAKIIKNIGPVKIESLPCCIHFVSTYTFGACWAMKAGIRIDLRVNRKIKPKCKFKVNHMSTNRYLYYFDIFDKKEIDPELLGWIKESYHLNN